MAAMMERTLGLMKPKGLVPKDQSETKGMVTQPTSEICPRGGLCDGLLQLLLRSLLLRAADAACPAYSVLAARSELVR
ncbi:Protein of unknown function [Gryllus bimaculatus]|nr:Protein of unknown function [Gryllus bimaculatus]